MDDDLSLARQFEANRGRLRSVAYRMLGSPTEADDAVQEAWLRLSRAGSSGVENLSGWLTTVVARVCLDMLRSRKSRREESFDAEEPEVIAGEDDGLGPEREALLADSIGLALLAVLETLTPPERVAFVLHEMFDLPFDEIAPIVGRSSAATRQLASRARRRVQGATQGPEADRAHDAAEAGRPGETGHTGRSSQASQRAVVDAFLAASRAGDLGALLALLDPDVVLRADATAVQASIANAARGAPVLAPELRGAAVVAGTFSGRAQAARPALIDGAVGTVWAPGGRPRAVFAFRIADGKVLEMELIADPMRISQLALTILDDGAPEAS
jgi:RNA polymerase sigma factor (sigma-70 family)